MRAQQYLRWAVCVIVLAGALPGAAAWAEGETAESRGLFERIGDTAKKVGHKIEQGFTKTAKKIEDKHIGDKIERKLKKAATKTEEGLKKTGKKIDQKLQ
ncbi:MAG: hypothetical protein OEV08_06510 [Nitrospira sp.]|nr:hypothetical protein [Nitrospira sp.]